MARSVSITRPPQRQPKRYDEQRPVLQLPLHQPEWREPPEADEQAKQDRERGVAVIDFFI